MDVRSINHLLSLGEIERDDLWPCCTEMESKACQFRFEFGLDTLPAEPGLITIRGPRQFGKSTWLELQLRASIEWFGRGSAYYLNGDELTTAEALVTAMEEHYPMYAADARVKRLFIDEITAVSNWPKAIKRVIDRGRYRDVLIVTTGSKAADLRHGAERLPGRKGQLARSEYLFLPISYREFAAATRQALGDNCWLAYLLTGGSPIACNDIFRFERLPEYFIQLTRDWILGEVVATGRSRVALAQLFQIFFRCGGNPVGYAQLARDAGLANNTVASGYVEQLSDLLALLPAWPWDANTDTLQLRKRCKFHFINGGVVTAWHPAALRYVHEVKALPAATQGVLLEWLVAQEIWRRAVLAGVENPEAIGYWTSKEHEIDFVTPDRQLIEVKRGRAGPLDFAWFPKCFPRDRLTVICDTPFATPQVEGVTVEQFLLNAPTCLGYAEELPPAAVASVTSAPR